MNALAVFARAIESGSMVMVASLSRFFAPLQPTKPEADPTQTVLGMRGPKAGPLITSQSHCVHVAGLPSGKIDRNQPSGALTAESLKGCAETEGCEAWKWAYCANLKAMQFTAEADLLGGNDAEMYLFYSFTAILSVKCLVLHHIPSILRQSYHQIEHNT